MSSLASLTRLIEDSLVSPLGRPTLPGETTRFEIETELKDMVIRPELDGESKRRAQAALIRVRQALERDADSTEG